MLPTSRETKLIRVNRFQGLLVRGLGRLKAASISAIVTLGLRPLISANFSDKFMTIFLINVLAVPALVHHLQQSSPEVCHLSCRFRE